MNATEGSSPSKVGDISRFVFIIIGSLEVVSGVAGNCLLLTVLLTTVRSLGMRSLHHYFIANLALTDLVTLGYWLPFFVLDLIVGKHPVANEAHCKANGFIIAVCLSTGIFSLTCISLNRYLHVCHNHLYRRVFTRARTIACCVCLWVFSSLLALPPLVNVSTYGYSNTSHICSIRREQQDSAINNVYPKAMIVIFAVVPMCVVGYLNYGIFRYWKMARLKLSTKYPLIRTDRVKREDVLETVTENRKIEMATLESEILPEQNVAENIGIVQSEMSTGVGINKSETSTSDLQDEADESVASDEKASMSDPPGLEQQQDTQPLDVQPVRPLWGRHADNDLQEQSLQPHTANSDLQKEAVKADENNGDPQIAILEDNPGQQRSQQCLSSQNHEALRNTIKTQKKKVDKNCSRGLRQPQRLACAQASGPSLTGCKQLKHRRRKEVAREMAFVRSLCVVFFLMLFCFFPFGVAMIVDSFNTLPPNVVVPCNLILFFNSSVNWIVYGVMNQSFKRGYITHMRRVVRMCWPQPCARSHEERMN